MANQFAIAWKEPIRAASGQQKQGELMQKQAAKEQPAEPKAKEITPEEQAELKRKNTEKML